MHSVLGVIGDRKLKHVRMPGSHDAGMYQVAAWSVQVSIDALSGDSKHVSELDERVKGHMLQTAKQELAPKLRLRTEPKRKNILGPRGFTYLVHFTSVRSRNPFKTGLDRLDNVFCRMVKMWTGCRSHELVWPKRNRDSATVPKIGIDGETRERENRIEPRIHLWKFRFSYIQEMQIKQLNGCKYSEPTFHHKFDCHFQHKVSYIPSEGPQTEPLNTTHFHSSIGSLDVIFSISIFHLQYFILEEH